VPGAFGDLRRAHFYSAHAACASQNAAITHRPACHTAGVLAPNAHSGADPAGFDRESRLLCAFLICCYETIRPRSTKSKAAKPVSAFKVIGGVRSAHRRAGIFMVSTKQLTMVMKGITAEPIKEHGSESLLPESKDPIGPTL